MKVYYTDVLSIVVSDCLSLRLGLGLGGMPPLPLSSHSRQDKKLINWTLSKFKVFILQKPLLRKLKATLGEISVEHVR